MKKFFALFFVMALLMTAIPCGASYIFDAELYSIELPDDFDLVGENEFISDKGDAFSVSYEENTDEFCIADLSEENMKSYVENLAAEGARAFKSLDLNGNMQVVSYKKIENLNRKTALEIVFKTSLKREESETVRLQKIYLFSGEENKYTFTYTAKDEKDINAFDEAFSTIVINEKQIEGKNDSLVTLGMCAVIVALILVGVIKFVIRTPYKKQSIKK